MGVGWGELGNTLLRLLHHLFQSLMAMSHYPPHTNRLSYSDHTIERLETEMLQDLEQGLRLLSSGCDAM